MIWVLILAWLLELGIYSWVNGEVIEKPDLDDLKQAVDFVHKLYDVSKSSQHEYIGAATEACLSANDLVKQVEKRIDRLLSVADKYFSLKHFLIQQFIPLWKKLLEYSLDCWHQYWCRYVGLACEHAQRDDRHTRCCDDQNVQRSQEIHLQNKDTD